MTPNEVIHGKNCFVYILSGDDYYLIGCGISFSFEVENELILRTGINDGLFPKKRVRQTSFRGSVNSVMISESDAAKVSAFFLIQEGVRRAESTYKFEFTDGAAVTKTITGSLLVQAVNISADTQSFSKFDLSIEGTGAFSMATDSPTPVTDENVDSDTWVTVAGETSVTGNSIDTKNTTGKVLLACSRTGVVHDIITSGTPSGMEAKFDTATGTTSFDPGRPFEADETVWQMWKDA
jgi:hypothetical protein